MSHEKPRPEYATVAVVADLLNVRPKTVRRWAREGLIPCVRVGRNTLRFHIPSVQASLRTTTAKAGRDGQ